jgi:hypothetical protein
VDSYRLLDTSDLQVALQSLNNEPDPCAAAMARSDLDSRDVVALLHP